MIWKDDNSENEKLLENILTQVVEAFNLTFPEICPICKYKDVHFYYNTFKGSRGGLWVWCSNCGYYTHGSTIDIPSWWRNCKEVLDSDLYCQPIELDKKKDIIDKHVNFLLNKGEDKS